MRLRDVNLAPKGGQPDDRTRQPGTGTFRNRPPTINWQSHSSIQRTNLVVADPPYKAHSYAPQITHVPALPIWSILDTHVSFIYKMAVL